MYLLKWFLVVLLSILSAQLSAHYELTDRCKDYEISDFIQNCGGCGLCQSFEVDDKYIGLYCDYEYLENIFVPESKYDCQLVNSCNNVATRSECKGFPCIPFLGTFKCNCDSLKFGRKCQYEVSTKSSTKDYAVVENIFYTPYFVMNRYLAIAVLFSHVGKGVEVHVETLLEKLVFNSSMVKKITFDESYCKVWFPDFLEFCKTKIFNLERVRYALLIRIPFPGRDFRDNARPSVQYEYGYAKEDRGFGKSEKVKLKVFNSKISDPVMDTTFTSLNFLVSPELSICEPNLQIRYYGETMYNAVKLARRDEIIMTVAYIFPIRPQICSQVQNKLIRTIWTFWKMGVNHDELGEGAFKEVSMVNSVTFKPYSLDFGQYKSRFNITVLESIKECFTCMYSYFEVLLLNLEAVIQGGDVKTVYINTQYLVLSGIRSTNPNLNMFKEKHDLGYYWNWDRHVSCKQRHENTLFCDSPFANDTYTFTLTVSSKRYELIATTTQKIIMQSSMVPTLEIVCKQNCGISGFQSNPYEIIYLEVLISIVPLHVKMSEIFVWRYSAGEDETYELVDKIRQPNTPSKILIILPNTLSEGRSYTFQVEGEAQPTGQAKMNIRTAKSRKLENCSITGSVNKVLEKIIKCTLVPDEGLSANYDILDRFPDSEDKGRLISSGKSNVAKAVEFTRGKLYITATDQFGMIAGIEYPASLFPKSKFIDSVNELLNFVKRPNVDFICKTNAMTIIVDTLASSKDKFPEASKILQDLLDIASKENVNNLAQLKITMNSIEILANETLKSGLSRKDVTNLSKITVKLSQALHREHKLLLSNKINDLTTTQILLLSQTIIGLCNIVYLSRNDLPKIAQVDEDDMYTRLSNLREITMNTITSIEEVISSLTLKTLPHLSPTVIEGDNISVWIKEDTPQTFYVLSLNQTSNDKIPLFVVSQILAKSLSQISNSFVFQTTVISGNPFWWHKDLNIITNTVDLKIGIKHKYDIEHITDLTYPIQVHLDYVNRQNISITGSVQQLDPSELDGVAIHKLKIDKKGKLKLTFLNLKDGEEIKVLVLQNFRPDQEVMVAVGENITKSSPVYIKDIPEPLPEDGFDLYYLGILPGPNVAVGQVVNYSFDIDIMHCGSWHHTGWRTLGCQVKNIFPEKLLCECYHLSVIGGFLSIPMNTVDPFEDYDLFLTVPDNPFVAIFVTCLLVVFLILLLWAIKKDFQDKKSQCAIYLDDNSVYDEFPYLIVVYTGARLFAGTTSNVGVCVEGQDSVSRRHILKSEKFKTMKRSDDNWFILYTPHFLGKITKLSLWTDNSGKRPDWYCEKIIVIDLTTNQLYTFLFNSWFSVKEGGQTEIIMAPETTTDREIEDFVSDNLKLGFKESHVWISVVAKHPRSAVNTAQRLSVATSGLFVTLLVSCMFYGVLDPSSEDDFDYSFTEKQIIVGTLSMIISAFLVNIIISLFRKRFYFNLLEESDIEESVSSSNSSSAEKDNSKSKTHEDKFKNLKEEPMSEQTNQPEDLSARFSQSPLKLSVVKNKLVQKKVNNGIKHKNIKMARKSFRQPTANPSQRNLSMLLRFYTAILKIFVRRKEFVPVHLEVDVIAKFKKHGPLSICFYLLPWFASVILTIICAFFIVLYSLKFGKSKSLKWLSSVAISLVEGIVLITPFKIIMIAIMSGSIKRKVYDPVKYSINWKNLKTYRKCLSKSQFDLDTKFVILRYQNIYKPLTHAETFQKRKKQKRVDKFWEIIDISVVSLIPLLLIIHSDTLWTTRYYWHNYYFTSLLSTGHKQDSFEMNKLTNITHYTDLFKREYIPLMYKTKCYYQQSLKGAVHDGTLSSKVSSGCFKTHVGLPRLYQLRLKPGLCREPIFSNLPDSCPSRLTKGTEDDDVYNEGWESTGIFGLSRTPWTPLEGVDVVICGSSGQKYLAGGYAADLALGPVVTEEIITDLDKERWLDKYTSVLLFEQSFYTVDTKAITQLLSVTETFHIGTLMNRIVACTVNIMYELSLIDIILSLTISFFAMRVIIHVNQKGLKNTLLNVWNICDVVIICLSVYCVILYIKHFKVLSSFLYKYQNRKKDEYFSFLQLTVYLDYIEIVLIVLTVTVTSRCIKNLYIITYQTITKIVFVLSNSCLRLLWVFMVVCLIFLILWRCIFPFLNRFTFSRNTLLILHPMDYKHTVEHCIGHSCKVSSFILTGVSYLFILVTIIYCIHFYNDQNNYMRKKGKQQIKVI